MTQARKFPEPAKSHSLMPKSQTSLRTLMTAMIIMCYLACLSIGSLLLITRAVNDWSSDIASEVTVQIRPTDKDNMKQKLAAAEKILKNSAGVTAVKILDKQAGADLLKPWLGDTNILDQLPVPRLIAVTIDRKNPPDFDRLGTLLKSAIKGASLDTHRRWQAELTRMGSSLIWLTGGVLFLIVASAIALVVFASKSAMSANQQVVEVLHLVGATDPFIARQVQWQFLKAGLFSGLIGMVAGMITFLLLGMGTSTSGLGNATWGLLVGAPEITLQTYVLFLQVPIIATLICLVAARLAILRILRNAI